MKAHVKAHIVLTVLCALGAGELWYVYYRFVWG